jgi:hypothetical protein
MSNKLDWQFIPANSNTAPLSVAGPYVISHRWNIVPTREDETRKVWYFPLSYRPPNEHHHIDNFNTLDEAKQAAQNHADKLAT